MEHIFISYSRKDSEFVDRLSLALEQCGSRTWKDVNDIVSGEVWTASISKAIRESRAFLVVLSPQSASSGNVSKELAVAAKHRRPILPVLYQPCELSDKMDYDLAELQWVDFCERPFDEAFEHLARALGGKRAASLAATSEVKALRDFILSKATVPKDHLAIHPPQPASPLPSPVQPSLVPQSRPEINFCIYCGAKILPENAFCTDCGRKVPH